MITTYALYLAGGIPAKLMPFQISSINHNGMVSLREDGLECVLVQGECPTEGQRAFLHSLGVTYRPFPSKTTLNKKQ